MNMPVKCLASLVLFLKGMHVVRSLRRRGTACLRRRIVCVCRHHLLTFHSASNPITAANAARPTSLCQGRGKTCAATSRRRPARRSPRGDVRKLARAGTQARWRIALENP